ncbi:hypothetical protein OU426_05080 [Frigidibacter sp. RF13]|uniref:hypothetical protein n=1 Tax=Frigidibacter sp. RF13 TaxID=2997340 RepID=UPI002271F134|nr:hypothetical protein [Frigidibacter sp. RF13]MCY1126221.1 hypothetical protein [Frigidibacter sp. RF13]
MANRLAIWACGCVLVAAGCVGGGGKPDAFDLAVADCQRDLKVPGHYEVSRTERDGLGLPVVTAGPGATLRGQVLMSECVGQRLAAATAP